MEFNDETELCASKRWPRQRARFAAIKLGGKDEEYEFEVGTTDIHDHSLSEIRIGEVFFRFRLVTNDGYTREC
jgi:hypothetical protein